MKVTWTCHVCGCERPDEEIGVARHQIVLANGVQLGNNVRYCVDDEDCTAMAMRMTHDALYRRHLMAEMVAEREEGKRRSEVLRIGFVFGLMIAFGLGVVIGALCVAIFAAL